MDSNKSSVRNVLAVDGENEFEFKQKWMYDQMRNRIPQFSNIRNFKICCGTWNVNDKVFPDTNTKKDKLLDWLHPPGSIASDIYAIGFQEIVDLNTVNVVISSQKSTERLNYWQHLIETNLKCIDGDLHEFTLIIQKQLVGLILFIYVKKCHIQNVRDIWGTVIPTGVMGIMGNKGGICIRLDINMTSICFICSHFHAGRESVSLRNSDYRNIIDKLLFVPSMETNVQFNKSFIRRLSISRMGPLWYDGFKQKEYTAFDHDLVFWLGDLNYRIDDKISTEDVFTLVTSGNEEDWLALREKDQLIVEKNKRTVFENFLEGEILFPPSYKFQPGTDIYDCRPDKKLRAPAWCDRVLWRTVTLYDDAVRLLLYRTGSLNLSDHKPVCAFFDCDIRVADHVKERQAYQELLIILDRWENESAPKLELVSNQIDFGVVQYFVEKNLSIQLKNVGVGFAQWGFVPKMDESIVYKKWLKLSPSYGALAPGKCVDIAVRLLIDQETQQDIRINSLKVLEDIIVLRVLNGSDFFILISAKIDENSNDDSFLLRPSMQIKVDDIYNTTKIVYGDDDDEDDD